MSGGPANLMNNSDETVLVINEALVGVMIRFICENPRSHSLEEMGIVCSREEAGAFFHFQIWVYLFN